MSQLVVPGGFGIAAVRINLTGDPDPMFVTFGVGADLGGTDDPEDAANAVLGVFQVRFGAWMADDYSIASCELRYHTALEAPGDPFHIAVSTAPAVAGSRPEPPLPQNCAVLVHKRTAMAGRQQRGRFYMPGVTEDAVGPTGALLPGDTLNGLNTAASGFIAAYEASTTSSLYLLHSDPVGLPGAPAPTLLTTLTVDPTIATQRRRLR